MQRELRRHGGDRAQLGVAERRAAARFHHEHADRQLAREQRHVDGAAGHAGTPGNAAVDRAQPPARERVGGERQVHGGELAARHPVHARFLEATVRRGAQQRNGVSIDDASEQAEADLEAVGALGSGGRLADLVERHERQLPLAQAQAEPLPHALEPGAVLHHELRQEQHG